MLAPVHRLIESALELDQTVSHEDRQKRHPDLDGRR